MKTTRIIGGLVTLLGVAGTASADEKVEEPSAKGAVELLFGHEGGNLDVKLAIPVEGDVRVANRLMLSADYEGNPSYMNLFRVDYHIGEGFNLTGSLLGGAVPFRPFVGGIYLGKFDLDEAGSFGLVSSLAVSTESDPRFLGLASVSYRLPFGEEFALQASAEDRTILNLDGHVLSVQELRLGVSYHALSCGVGLNLKEVGDLAEGVQSNLGGYCKIER